MTDSQYSDQNLLLHAALDGELDASGMLEMEAKVAADPALAAEYARLVALRDAIRMRLPRQSAPESLRVKVASMTSISNQAIAPRRRWLPDASYRSLAASLMLGAVLGAGAFGLFASRSADDGVQSAIVAGYVRGRLSGQPVDVATSDRHTVKPWLAGKVATPTTVVYLAADGFPLAGGRIDIVSEEPVATLVYKRREHQIALSEMKAPGGDASCAPGRETRDGYSLLRWTDKGRLYMAISDLPPAELDAFGAAFRRAAAAEREEAPKP